MAPVRGATPSPFLTPVQAGAMAAGVVAVAVGAAVAGPHVQATDPASVGGFTARAAEITAQCMVADVVATKLRHPTAELAWREFFGRGGHVPGVGAGLGVAFAAAAALAAVGFVDLAPVLAAHGPDFRQFFSLFLGIQPFVTLDAALNPKHRGRRGQALLEGTLRNAGGSAFATVFEPAVGSVLSAALAKIGPLGQAIADQLTDIAGYGLVLVAGWLDVGPLGLDDRERDRNFVA